ncbi:hypothetical protein [Runella aurantiaca]|uniref:Uncharacterized protein n=1 Tax=Runella aurantiaca TaxID=2282308 RepID=A0A369IGM0_9BACT|nr:hypothetical protein [Runella aurantiaca]RDB07497.1 hypothetical protein DVG78_00045 [Runella aurantiaca]
MKAYESLQDEIQYTLESIGRINAALVRHEAQEIPDTLAIVQYQELKTNLTKQLLALLAEMDVNVALAA